MTTISAGANPTITLVAGTKLVFSAGGAGLATVLRVGALAPLRNMLLGAAPITIGPFAYDHTVDVACERALTYILGTTTGTAADAVNGGSYPAQWDGTQAAPQLQALVSGAVIPFVSGNPLLKLPKTAAAFAKVRGSGLAGFPSKNTAVAIAGNSVTRGLASNFSAGGSAGGAAAAWPTLMAANLRGLGIPTYTDSWWGSSQATASSPATMAGYDTRWGYTGAPTAAQQTPMSLGGNFWLPVAANTFSFTPGTRQTDSYEMWYLGRTSYTVSYDINVNGGASLGTVSTTAGADGYYKSATISATLGNNVWNAVASAGVGGALVGMVTRASATPEISIFNVAAGSSLTTMWQSNASFFAAANGLVALIASGGVTWVHIQLQVNDEKLTTQITTAQLTANLVAMYTYLAAAGGEVSFGSEAPIAITGSNGIPYAIQQAYADAVKAAADATGCLYVDNFSNFPTYEIGVLSPYNYWQGGELIHPNVYGQAHLAGPLTQVFRALWGA